MRTCTLILLLLAGLLAAEPAELQGYAWYLPYEQLLRVRYEVPRALTEKAGGGETVCCFRLDRDGQTLIEETWPGRATGDYQVKRTLGAGTYQASLVVLTAGAPLAASANDIVVRSYDFEHNGIGEERVVVPPFEPVTTAGDRASVWGRRFTFAPNGLPASIEVLGREILGEGGARIVLNTPDGPSAPVADRPFRLRAADGYDAAGTGRGHLGPLKYTFTGRLEYDGCYFIRLDVDSGDAEVPVNSLALEIAFAQADTFSFQKNDRDLNTAGGYGRFGGIRADDDGTIFDGRRLPRFSAYGMPSENDFVPAIYVGTGSRGLWYYAEDEWDWYLNPEREQAVLERVDGQVRLRVMLVNDAHIWRGRRTFEFVLMPQPVKPMPAGWRALAWSWPEDRYIHDTSGWRYYGDGVNAFSLPTPEHYATLGAVLSGEQPRPEGAHGRSPVRKPDDDRPLVLYGSSLMAGSGPANGEWDTYAGDWTTGRWPFFDSVADRFADKKSYGGFPWDRDISLHPCSVSWSDSWVDFAVYYQQQLSAIAKVNGTWFDNQSCFTIPAYTDDGLDRHLLENPQRFPTGVPLAERPGNYGRRYHILQFRRYLRRLVTAQHTVGIESFWLVNQHPTWSFAQMAWHIEADYYPARHERDLVEHLGVAGFRAHVRTQGGLIARLHSNVHKSDQPPREGHSPAHGVRLDDATAYHLPGADDTHYGLCLLHDIGMIGAPRRRLRLLADEFSLFRPDVQFHPYWAQQSAVVDSERVYASVYSSPAAREILIVLFNEKKAPRGLTVPLTVAAEIAGIPVNRLHDAETGEPMSDLDPAAPGCQSRVYVPPRNVRLLVGR